MSVNNSTALGNPASPSISGPAKTARQAAEKLVSLSERLRSLILRAVEEADSFDQTERKVWERVREIGFEAMRLFVSLQGDGDLGEQAAVEDDRQLVRSTQPAGTVVRSIFGEHAFRQFTYSRGKNKTIELRPVSARMQLPEHRWSYLLQEFSQLFGVDQAFHQAADNLQQIFGGKFSVDTLEQTNRRMGVDADRFLDRLPTPARKDEGELLVATADCKGVPLVKEDAAKTAAFETAKKRPGNRRPLCQYRRDNYLLIYYCRGRGGNDRWIMHRKCRKEPLAGIPRFPKKRSVAGSKRLTNYGCWRRRTV
jgi:hypothetical protein